MINKILDWVAKEHVPLGVLILIGVVVSLFVGSGAGGFFYPWMHVAFFVELSILALVAVAVTIAFLQEKYGGWYERWQGRRRKQIKDFQDFKRLHGCPRGKRL